MALTQVQDGMLGYDGGSFAFRNRIINGDMRIDQRNAGASVTFNASATQFVVDRFGGYEDTDGVMTGQQDSSAPVGFTSSLKLTTTTADTSLGATQRVIFRQNIEGQNIADLGWGSASAKTVTLSFWVRSSLTGTHGGVISNSAQDRSYPFAYSISVADTWEYKTVTIPGDTTGTWLTTNGLGMRVLFGMGVGSTYSGTAGSWAATRYESVTGATSVIGTLNATWYITGVQLEAGTVATPFEHRQYGQELALCQRYYEKSYDYATVPGSSGSLQNGCVGLGIYTNTPAAYNRFGNVFFKVAKRAGPTMIMYAPATGNVDKSTSGDGATDISFCSYQQTNQSGFNIAASVGGSTVTNYYTGFFAWTASSEL